MAKLTVPEELGRKLKEVRGTVRVYDDAGQTLGLFTAAADLILEPTITPEELDRRETEPGYTTEQVLAHLRSL